MNIEWASPRWKGRRKSNSSSGGHSPRRSRISVSDIIAIFDYKDLSLENTTSMDSIPFCTKHQSTDSKELGNFCNDPKQKILNLLREAAVATPSSRKKLKNTATVTLTAEDLEVESIQYEELGHATFKDVCLICHRCEVKDKTSKQDLYRWFWNDKM